MNQKSFTVFLMFCLSICQAQVELDQILDIYNNGTHVITVGNQHSEIRTMGKMGIGLTIGEFNSNAQLGPELFVRGNLVVTGNITNAQGATLAWHQPMEKHGLVILDEQGEAWVEIKELTGAKKQEFSYHLTCIGEFTTVYIAQKMKQQRFKIAGGNPGQEVSWQICALP